MHLSQPQCPPTTSPRKVTVNYISPAPSTKALGLSRLPSCAVRQAALPKPSPDLNASAGSHSNIRPASRTPQKGVPGPLAGAGHGARATPGGTGDCRGCSSLGPSSQAACPKPLPPPSPPPLPPSPSPPDHSCGGHTLVSTPAELEAMLDTLAAAAVGGVSASSGGSGGKTSSGGSSGGSLLGGIGGGGGGRLGPLAVDCEGVELGRPGGKLCLLQLSARCGGGRGGGGVRCGGGPPLVIWLVDVAALGRRAFRHLSPRGAPGLSLGGLLEDPAVIKYLYDVRRDAEALSSEYGVRLRGVVDLQLADVAVRQAEGGLRAGGWVEGLVSALSRGLAAGGRSSAPARLAADLAAATSTSRLYHESNNTRVWTQRPLTPELCEYAATDVRYLHALADALSPRMNRELADRVVQESRRRIVSPMPNNKDLRAAAPVMIARHSASSASPSSAAGVAAAAAGASGGVRSSRSPSGAAAAAARGRGGDPYMGLMEWLTAALLLRYDRCGVAAEPAAARVGLAAGQSAVRAILPNQAGASTTVMASAAVRQRPGASAPAAWGLQAPSIRGMATAAFSRPGEGRAAAAVAAAEAAAIEAATAVTAVVGEPLTSGVRPTERAVALPPPLHTAAPAPALVAATAVTSRPAAKLQGSGFSISPDVASAVAAAASPGPGLDPAAAATAAAAAAAADGSLVPPPVAGEGGAGGEEGKQRRPFPPQPQPPGSWLAAGHQPGSGIVDGALAEQREPRAAAAAPPPPLTPMALGPVTDDPSPEGAVVACGADLHGAMSAGVGRADGTFAIAGAATPPPPPPPPLLVPSMETMIWAEHLLSDLWLDLRTKYGYIGPDEDWKLARLAAWWLGASQRGLLGQAGGPGTASGAAGRAGAVSWSRRDPGLCWLLPG